MPSNLAKAERRSGTTLIEAIVAVMLASLIGAVLLRLTQGSMGQVDSTQKQSAYYLSLGTFLEVLRDDVRMAHAVRVAPPGFELDIATAAGIDTITYQKLAGNKIERLFQGRRQVFPINQDTATVGTFVFDIKEVTP